MRKATHLVGGLILVASLTANAAPGKNKQAGTIALQHLSAAQGKMNLPAGTDFVVRSTQSDDLGQSHVRVDQFVNGVKVFGGELVIHISDGSNTVLSVTDDAKRGIAVSTKPSLAAGRAIAIAHHELQPLGAYNVEPSSELVIFTQDDGQSALAYHVHAELENRFELKHQDFMIDAQTGAILDSWDTLETSGSTATGVSQYSGSVTLNTNSLASGSELRDMTRGTGGNVTRNLNHATTGTGTVYTDPDTSWGDGLNYVEGSSTTAANGETAAVDAHYGLQKTWDYYKNILGRSGIDGLGTATYNRVHYSNSYDNAFWSDSCFCMTYGDGSSFTTLTSIDVAGHEMTHGVTAKTSGLAYRRESGGLNEATSDIFGTMVEFYANPASANYKIGEQLRASGAPLRYMYKPSLDSRSADCWSKSVGNLDVHYSSGVGNHFFYLLAEGSNPAGGQVSPTCNGAVVTGIDRDAAAKIYFRALDVYFTSSTNYAGARSACLKAAADLAGTLGANYSAQVAAAWSAVNVN